MMIDETLRDVLAGDPADPRVRPADLHLDRKSGLTIRWADGVTSFFPTVYLRKNCPCAACRDERKAATPTGRGVSLNILPQGIDKAAEVADAGLVGSYAMQITWGDGHSTGIYDFRYLRAIAPPPADG